MELWPRSHILELTSWKPIANGCSLMDAKRHRLPWRPEWGERERKDMALTDKLMCSLCVLSEAFCSDKIIICGCACPYFRALSYGLMFVFDTPIVFPKCGHINNVMYVTITRVLQHQLRRASSSMELWSSDTKEQLFDMPPGNPKPQLIIYLSCPSACLHTSICPLAKATKKFFFPSTQPNQYILWNSGGKGCKLGWVYDSPSDRDS